MTDQDVFSCLKDKDSVLVRAKMYYINPNCVLNGGIPVFNYALAKKIAHENGFFPEDAIIEVILFTDSSQNKRAAFISPPVDFLKEMEGTETYKNKKKWEMTKPILFVSLNNNSEVSVACANSIPFYLHEKLCRMNVCLSRFVKTLKSDRESERHIREYVAEGWKNDNV